MSLTPGPIPMESEVPQAHARPWYNKILRFCFIVFCFEIGVFLLVFPWLQVWERNMLPTYAFWLEDLWGNPYFRGALSGVGLVNIYISFVEIVRLLRGDR